MASFAVPKALLLSSNVERPLDANTKSTAEKDQTQQPAFITTQTLATFAGASAVATFLWKTLAAGAGKWADRRWVPLAICGLIGIWFILTAFNNAKTPADYYGAVMIGAFNAVQLWTAVVGLDVVLDPVGVDQTGGAT
jgi:hypothetical protein